MVSRRTGRTKVTPVPPATHKIFASGRLLPTIDPPYGPERITGVLGLTAVLAAAFSLAEVVCLVAARSARDRVAPFFALTMYVCLDPSARFPGRLPGVNG